MPIYEHPETGLRVFVHRRKRFEWLETSQTRTAVLTQIDWFTDARQWAIINNDETATVLTSQGELTLYPVGRLR